MEKIKPEIHKTSYIAKSSIIIGNVKIGKNCGIFPNAVIRGDQNSIYIDDGTNVQDCCVIHTDKEHNVRIGKNVSIGHGAVVHGSIIEDNCLIGMNVTILNGVKIEEGVIIGANALVRSDQIIPKNSLVIGIPGKVIKQDKKFKDIIIKNAKTYREISKNYLNGNYFFYNK
jgi:carbonic anhydrase/acetyltransferase-like protein (isoleucine patch superfamily)